MSSRDEAAQYRRLGFRVLRCDGASKRPKVGGFGSGRPEFSCHPQDFTAGDRVALLCGPCPALGDDWLVCLDYDGGLTRADVEARIGQALPDTLTSKAGAHAYYRVPPGPGRDLICQRTDVLGGRDAGHTQALDIKWAGGYAIEPGAWDEAFSVDAIAELPESASTALMAVRGGGRGNAPRPVRSAPREAMGELPSDLLDALAERWPEPGAGCHDAALALGGVLADSRWADADVEAFSVGLFERTGTSDRTDQVLNSLARRRADPSAAVKGWPSLRKALSGSDAEVRELLDRLQAEVPGLAPIRLAPRVNPTVSTPRAREGDGADAAGDEGEEREGLWLELGSAKEIARKVAIQFGRPLVFAEGSFWAQGADGIWTEEKPEARIHALIGAFDGALFLGPGAKARVQRFLMGRSARASILSELEVAHSDEAFFEDQPPGVAFRNGYLDLATRELRPLKDARVRHALPWDWDPGLLQGGGATPLHWISFVRSVWGNDREAVDLVHRMLGYLLSGRNDLQKIFLLIGPPRAGKGTVIKLIETLFGSSCCGFKASGLDDRFALAGLVGKAVAVDPDCRRSSSRFKDEAGTVERLLSISAGDTLTIQRKFLGDVSRSLPVRLVIATNPPFGLRDVGGALASRLVVVHFQKSFLGHEDVGLIDRLRGELPAIVALALQGLDRLNADGGKFPETAAAAEEREAIMRAQQPLQGFWEEEIDDSDPKAQSPRSVIYQKARDWCDEEGHARMSNTKFSEFLRTKGVKIERRREGGTRGRFYIGIKLRNPGAPGLTIAPRPKPEKDER